MATQFNDDILGDLRWFLNGWRADRTIEYFSGFGGRFGMPEGKTAQRFNGFIRIGVDTNENRRKPDRAQRMAWKAICDRGEDVWHTVFIRMLDEYRERRPILARWWRRAFGEYQLNWSLPEAIAEEDFRALVKPFWIYVKPPRFKGAPSQVSICVGCTWRESAYLEVVIVNAKLIRMDYRTTADVDAAFMTRNLAGTIADPVFGELVPNGPVVKPTHFRWEGLLNCNRFSEFGRVACDKARLHNSIASNTPFHATLWIWWLQPIGKHRVYVHTNGDEQPTDRQRAAFEQFAKNSENNANKIMRTICDEYVSRYGELVNHFETAQQRDGVKAGDIDLVLPAVEDAHDLEELVQLRWIHVFPDDGKAESVRIGFQFWTAWSLDRINILWSNGAIEAIELGGDIALPSTRGS